MACIHSRALVLVSVLAGLAIVLPIVGGMPVHALVPSQSSPVDHGAQLFSQHCAGCHIHGGNIIRRGKTLKLAALQRAGLDSPQAIAAIASGGIGQMGGYAAVLGDSGAQQVGTWVWEQAQAGWPRN